MPNGKRKRGMGEMSWFCAFITPTVLEETWDCFPSVCPAAGATCAKQRMLNPSPSQKWALQYLMQQNLVPGTANDDTKDVSWPSVTDVSLESPLCAQSLCGGMAEPICASSPCHSRNVASQDSLEIPAAAGMTTATGQGKISLKHRWRGTAS